MSDIGLKVSTIGLNVDDARIGSEIESPPIPTTLTPEELMIWDHICEQLRKAGIFHLTASLAISIVTKKYHRWVIASAELERLIDENGGINVKTTNGIYQPSQLSWYVEKLELGLLRLLPSCCLTIPTFAKVKALENGKEQGDLFLNEIKDFMRGRPN